ncbi:MAG: mechanosensitive ion channel [Chitinivibrionales bacterium]|nr:mechanosensitive ion channel [Chitinivibrionales bacterium]
MKNWLTPEFWQKVLQDTVHWGIQVLPSILLILILAFILLKLANVLVTRLKPIMNDRMQSGGKLDASEIEKRVDTLAGILASTLRITVWVVILMLLLKRLGVDVAPIIAGAGIIGLAVGFGAQELVRDFISGFFMLMENQVRTGDVAIVNGTGGLVQNVGLRTIVLRDLSGVVHVFQNGKINTLSNMTKEWSAMVFDIGVAYKEDTDKVVEIMKAVAEELRKDEELGPKILEPMEVFGVDGFGDSAVIVKGRLKTKPIQQWAIGRAYRRRLKKAFDEAGIEIPFPHRTIYWGEEIKPLEVKQ